MIVSASDIVVDILLISKLFDKVKSRHTNKIFPDFTAFWHFSKPHYTVKSNDTTATANSLNVQCQLFRLRRCWKTLRQILLLQRIAVFFFFQNLQQIYCIRFEIAEAELGKPCNARRWRSLTPISATVYSSGNTRRYFKLWTQCTMFVFEAVVRGNGIFNRQGDVEERKILMNVWHNHTSAVWTTS